MTDDRDAAKNRLADSLDALDQTNSNRNALVCYDHAFRVSYYQTDGQRRVHHSHFINFFEDARVEMLRAAGILYKDFEDAGRMLVVSQMNLEYHAAADFDDWLRVRVELTEVRKVRMKHRYTVYRDEPEDREQTKIVTGQSVIACVDATGRPRKLPPQLLSALS